MEAGRVLLCNNPSKPLLRQAEKRNEKLIGHGWVPRSPFFSSVSSQSRHGHMTQAATLRYREDTRRAEETRLDQERQLYQVSKGYGKERP